MTDAITLECGDMREILDRMALAGIQVDGCVTDAPYHLVSIVERFGKAGAKPARAGVFARSAKGFMGKEWDGFADGELIAFQADTWRRVFRVLKPGAHLAVFGAPRNFGLMQTAIIEAGFEVRDCTTRLMMMDELTGNFLRSLSDEQAQAFARIMGESEFGGYLQWIFSTGFPKSHNMQKAIGKLAGSTPDEAKKWEGWGTALKPCHEPILLARKPLSEDSIAANILKHGTGALNLGACRVEDVGDEGKSATRTVALGSSGTEIYGAAKTPGEWVSAGSRWPGNIVHDGSEEIENLFPMTGEGAFPASRKGGGMFTAASSSQSGMEAVRTPPTPVARLFYSAKAEDDDRLGSAHPTVKPVALMQWLVRLIVQPGGTVLDPFAGSGTTGEAALREGRRAILIEREPEYQADIRRRIELATAGPASRAAAAARRRAPVKRPEQSLFGDDETGET